ncbi:hypothetical protein K461DRAFT_173053 [Myriangium duriaei CBS 260.36]|uniref:Uncharacterized protein n=1 Tax=Myriangium duriaei CBS 260.36 TaxID=1168546 RepID=A0A9P4MIV2_9PEZI|nr:hypothetical protein K461DRAFT_173053 [Myriangium duriaei CBS 260.36]
MQFTILRPLRLRAVGPTVQPHRLLATRASPGQSSSIATPSPKPSDSPQEGDVKSSRAMDSRSSPDTASLAKPAEPGAAQGQDEEGSHPVEQDKNKPAGEKRKQTERQGQKPLDAGDK